MATLESKPCTGDGHDVIFHFNSFDTFRSELRKDIRNTIKEPNKAISYGEFVRQATTCNICKGKGQIVYSGYDKQDKEYLKCNSCPAFQNKKKEEIDVEWREYLDEQQENLTRYFTEASELTSILNKITDSELDILYKQIKELH